MQYLIDDKKFKGKFSKEEIQKLIDENKISLNTKIWRTDWGEWRMIRDFEFDLSRAKFESKSGLPENLFLSIFPFIDYLDRGLIFRKPFSWLYSIIGIINLILPIFLFYRALEINIFEFYSKFIIYFILTWLIVTYGSWVSFQLWWDRKIKVSETSVEGDEFVATLVLAHFVQTLGEWIGTWVGTVGFSVALLSSVILGYQADYLFYQFQIPFIYIGYLFIFIMPIFGFLIIVSARLIAEQLRALSAIANNTKKNN